MNFIDKIENIYGLYSSNIFKMSKKYIENDLFKNKNPYVQFLKKDDVKRGKIIPGGIYHIKYNNGGISVFKLCLIIEISKNTNKNNKLLIWAINLNYLTIDSNTALFQEFFNKRIEKNEEVQKIEEEKPFDLRPSDLYNYLKSQGYNYIIEPLNLNDIKSIKRISTKVLHYFLFYIDSQNTYNLLEESIKKLENSEIKDKLEELLKEYNELLNLYEENSKYYKKKLKKFEMSLKLYKN